MTARRGRAHFTLRTRIMLGVVLCVVVLLLVRLYFLQVVHGEEYRAQATDQYVHTYGGLYDRGTIAFKNGTNAATMKLGYLLAVNPTQIEDPEAVYDGISAHADIARDAFLARATKDGDPYEEIAQQISTTTAARIREQELPGVMLIPQRWRHYPGNALASHTIGFVGYDGDVRNGRYGLERYYEDVLARNESNLYVNFFAELFTNLRDIVFVPVNEREGSIVTTLDASVQSHLETLLHNTKDTWSSAFTAGIVMNPQTGAITAMAVTPSFDLNNFGEAEGVTYANPLVERFYEMGSIMKPITVAAGIDAGAIAADTTYTDRGSRTLDGYTFYNFDQRARGEASMQDVLSQSLNTGVAFVVDEMGKGAFRRYLHRFGINEETGIDLPNEVQNMTANLDSPRDIEYATASFGQGVALTPVSMARMLSALPDGMLEQPHVVSAIRSRTGVTHALTYDDMRQEVIRSETAEEITRMLVAVVDEALLEGSVKMERYSIAAKTGTAQIPSPEGGYYDDRFLHTFFGYFPAYDAEHLVFLMNVEPVGAQYASQTLTEPFMDMTQFLINHYDIPPDR